MAERGELEQLAQRYLDLWQDQVSALAADGDFTDMMGRLTAALGPAAAAAPWALWPAMLGALTAGSGAPGAGWPPSWPPGRPGTAEAGRRGRNGDTATAAKATGDGSQGATAPGASPGAAPGTTTAAAAPLGGGPDLGELARRLAALEERIAALEAGPGSARRSPRKGPAKGRA